MFPILAPIARNERSAAVRNLQDALILFLARSQPEPSGSASSLFEKLAPELQDQVYGDATAEAVARFQRDRAPRFQLQVVTGERVDEGTAVALNDLVRGFGGFTPAAASAAPDEFVVSGRVEFEDGRPVAEVRVGIFDRELGSARVPLGDSQQAPVTDSQGVFPAVRYRRENFAAREGRLGPNADLVFTVTSPNEQPMDISAVFHRAGVDNANAEILVQDLMLGFEAAAIEEVRIVLAGRARGGEAVEYQRLMSDLEPLLAQGSTPADLDQAQFRDFDFAARESGWDRALIETMALAWQMARAASREPSLLAETFYGLLRAGSPTEVSPLAATLTDLLDQDSRWQAKLEDSLAHRIIAGELALHLGRLRQLRANADAAATGNESRRGNLGDVLAQVNVDEAGRRAFLGAYQEHDGKIDAFWRDVVPQRLGWDAARISAVQDCLELADIVGYDVPLLTQLRGRAVTAARDLVTFDRQQLTDLVAQVGPAPDAPGLETKDKIARTVDSMTALVEAAYPTETIAHLARTSADPQLAAARDTLERFFTRESTTEGGFDIRTSPVTTFLEANGERVFREMQPEERTLLTTQLQRLQRVFRLSSDRAQSEALLELNLDSAFHIARFSPDFFAAEFGEKLGGAERASLVYARAEKIAGTVLYLYTELWQGVQSVKPMAIMSATAPDAISALKDLPAYKALFGSLDQCECEDCRSFYSPSAYFVDLLHMLDRPSLGAANPVEVLFQRRPDLAYIQLTCENTNTLIPYIDVANEILESLLANRAPKAFNIPPAPPNQTLPSPSADELRVNPVYLTAASSTFADQAYAFLQEAVFPLSLPLNLPLETTRAYLVQLGTNRAELMALFDGDTGLEALMARAAESLGLAPEEFELVSASKFGGASSTRAASDAELFGLSFGPTPATLFNHAAPEFVRNPGAPDERSALILSLQNVLGFVSTPPIPEKEYGQYDLGTEAAVNAFRKKNGLVENGRTDDVFWGALEALGMFSLSVLLCPVRLFLDRSGLTYLELIALVKTRFVNPNLQGDGDLDYLARLGIPATDVRAWIQAGFPALPPAMATQLAAVGEDPGVFTKWVKRRAQATLINTAFDAPCDLDRATLLHLDGSLLSVAELVTLFRFTRLQRKLGWTIEELDQALVPGSLASAEVFGTVLLMANLAQLRERTKSPIARLVCLWQSIPTHGDQSPYDRLFRNRAAQLIDPILELNRERTELAAAESATPPALSEHVGSLLAAFRLNAQDLAVLRSTFGLADDPSQPPAAQPRLTLAALSALYRPIVLATALRMSVTDLVALIDLTGLDVFERPGQTFPGHALAFIDVAGRISDSGVKVGELNYLCRAIAQPAGWPDTQRENWRRILATLLDGLRGIAAEEPLEDDPTGEELTARLTALLGADEARATTALIYGRDSYTANLAGLPPAFVFPAGVAGKAAYDAIRKQLRYRGALTATDLATLLSAPGVPAAVQSAYNQAVKSLAAQPRAFVARALKPLFTPAEAEAALIDTSSLDANAAPLPSVIGAKIDDILRRRRLVLSRSLVKQTLTTSTGLTADVVALLLEDEAVLHALGGKGAALQDFQGLEGTGLDADYFAVPTLAGVPVLQRVDPALGFDWHGVSPGAGVPAVGFSVRWTGHVYFPSAGEVTLHVRCTDGVRIVLNDRLVVDEWRDQPEIEFTTILRLAGGAFYPVTIEYYNQTGGALLELSWSGPSIPSAVVPAEFFYTAAWLDILLQRVERLHKIARLLSPFALGARDLRALSERGDLALDLVPLAEPATLAPAQAMFRQWLALRDFAALRDRYPVTDISLVDVPNAGTPAEAIARFARLSGVADAMITDLVSVFTRPVFDPVPSTWNNVSPDLGQWPAWQRIADALALVQRTGAAPAQLFAWAQAREFKQLPTGPETSWYCWTAHTEGGVDRTVDNTSRAQEAKNTVRARYDEAQWREVARSLNDPLRARRRSALTAGLLALPEIMRARVTNADRLFEFLLIDVEMEPCMDTSRIKQGILSVQLFIQRVLLNLDPVVPPTRIDRARWEWMKSDTLWVANRKVCFHTEQYIREDLRDDKTPVFTDLESNLLQDELNEPNAERTFRRYLEQLNGLAKLIVCGTCLDTETVALHVFGRTATVPFVFYHRRLDNPGGGAWTEGVWSPWQKLPVDVATYDDGEDSGALLVPITWNRRLYLFWLEFEQKPDAQHNVTLPSGFEHLNCWHIKLAWSEYKDGRWSPKQTGVPFLVSLPTVIFKKSPGTYPDTESFPTPLVFGPGVTTYPEEIIHLPGTTLTYTVPAWSVYSKRVLTDADDPLLKGVALSQEGEFASHDHHVDIVNVSSFLPKPSAHYLDATVQDDQLVLKVFSRYKGTAKGQGRTVTTDTIVIMQDGRRTDRKEQSTEDYAITDLLPSTFLQIGTFRFSACSAELEATGASDSSPYESLERPQYTINSFMALRNDWPGGSGLSLTTGAKPILGFVPTPFSVIDADNRSGFDRRGPFFYQDQRRCYLVTAEMRTKYFNQHGSLQIAPDQRAGLSQRAMSVATLLDRQLGLAADDSLLTNPWAHTALQHWADGPAVPAALRSVSTQPLPMPAPVPTPTPMPMPVLSGSIGSSTKVVLVNDRLKDVFASLYGQAYPAYTFTQHWHPYVCPYLGALDRGGVPALFTLANESLSDAGFFFSGVIGGPMTIILTNNFSTTYKPDPAQVVQPYPDEIVDFTRTGAYAKYNWEVFFHAPMTVALAHSRAGRYEDALRWFHYVFDPMTADPGPSGVRTWRFLPFRSVDTGATLDLLTYTGTDPIKLKQRAELQASIQDWLANPFNPHLIARRRPEIYMKYVFMQYLDNLFAWADQRFQTDTRESISEATQLYILISNLLGPRPERTPAPGGVAVETYQSLRGKLDALSNAQVDLETRLPFTQLFAPGTGAVGSLAKLTQTLYFCLPQNDAMLAYWDKVADRLFKIRHCMNIDGVVQQLPLYEPAIDPMVFVEAVAHGLDIGSVLNDLYAPLPRQRFSSTLQQALAMCGEVRSLGAMLLALFEKHDAEDLAVKRAGQESQLLDQLRGNKRLQISEAEESLQALENTGHVTDAKIAYYDGLLTQGLISEETDQLGLMDSSNERQETAAWIEATAQQLSLIPNISTGPTTFNATFGGANLSGAVSAVGRSYSYLAASYSYKAGRSALTGGQTRRAEEWRFQRDQAKRERSQIDRQLTAARIRKQITEGDLQNHEKQVENARGIEELLRTKFTNQALYGYMEARLCEVYSKCYQAAAEKAKRAERCWCFERGVEARFITSTAWDNSIRGLLAGEALFFQLKQMEQAYLTQQVNEFEITRHISVLQLDALALIALKTNGSCEVDVPEWLFDLDYAGHYFRRLKTVSITIPAVVGPYTSLSATLTLLSSKVRTSSQVSGAYDDEENYRADHLPVDAVAASSGQNDSGRFQLDFRDEKYLPFEGAGAISRWRIELPRKFRPFDYDTISDVVLHFKYTSRFDGTLAVPAQAALEARLQDAGDGSGTLFRFFSLRHEFPTEWQVLRTAADHAATLTITKDRFPYLVQAGALDVKAVHSAVILKTPAPAVAYKAILTPGVAAPLTLDWPAQPGRYRSAAKVDAISVPLSLVAADSGWKLQLTAPVLPADLDRIHDILLVVNYAVTL